MVVLPFAFLGHQHQVDDRDDLNGMSDNSQNVIRHSEHRQYPSGSCNQRAEKEREPEDQALGHRCRLMSEPRNDRTDEQHGCHTERNHYLPADMH